MQNTSLNTQHVEPWSRWLQQQKTTPGVAPVRQEQDTEDTTHTGSPKLDNRRLEKHDESPQSPDLNPIEQLCDLEEREIHIMDKSAATVWCYHINMDQHLWAMFPNPVKSMPWRIKAVLKAKEDPTRYQQGVPNKVASECVYIYIYILKRYVFLTLRLLSGMLQILKKKLKANTYNI